MPLLPAIGRRPRTRVTVALIYAALSAGAATMLWPFAVMIGGRFRGLADRRERGVAPRLLYDDAVLWRRYVEALFQESLDLACARLDQEAFSFEAFPKPVPAPALVRAWRGFLAERPDGCLETLGFRRADVSRTVGRALRDFR